ncbi:MAG: type II toxin-antitoxin system RelE/ParE family toxin, partial [Proteobacteria bacterium]|nr:type II toxin-antitoxin system RelE/ParE family toxin [Pseudomonadota bacterium]
MRSHFRVSRMLCMWVSTSAKSGIQPSHAERLKLILSWLSSAVEPKDMDLPGLKLHRLKGTRKDTWSVWVNGNWR